MLEKLIYANLGYESDSIIETTLINYYANDNSKLDQINQLNYINGTSI